MTFTNSIKRGLIDGLKSLVESHSVHFEPDPELIRQLKHFESKQSPTGNLILNARTGYHDDMVIALALAASRLDRKYWARVKVGGERRIFARLMQNLKKTIVFSR